MGQLNIPDSSTVYVDTSIIIYSVEKVPDYDLLLETLWQKLQADEVRVFSSELTLLETLVLPLRNASINLVNDYEQLLLFSSMELIPIDLAVLREAARLRAATNLKTPDAIHAATALSGGCTIFLTNDSQFRTVPGLSTIVLREILVA